MAVLGDKRDVGNVCVSLVFDLLGYQSLISSSCGTLDSAVGLIALERIRSLTSCVGRASESFPDGTELFQLNDGLFASLDLDIQIGVSITDPSGIASEIIPGEQVQRLLRFVGACAKLHQAVIAAEEEARLGPAGRSVICIGRRWDLGVENRAVTHRAIQANLAIAEAYMVDGLGSSAGFGNRCFYNFYVNDLIWFVLSVAKLSLDASMMSGLNCLVHPDGTFPENLRSPDIAPIAATVFHRQRTYYSLMSHHACRLP